MKSTVFSAEFQPFGFYDFPPECLTFGQVFSQQI